MIAPLRETDSRETRTNPSLHVVRRFVASTLLKPHKASADDAPRVPAWHAWLFTAWIIAAVVVCFAAALGL